MWTIERGSPLLNKKCIQFDSKEVTKDDAPPMKLSTTVAMLGAIALAGCDKPSAAPQKPSAQSAQTVDKMTVESHTTTKGVLNTTDQALNVAEDLQEVTEEALGQINKASETIDEAVASIEKRDEIIEILLGKKTFRGTGISLGTADDRTIIKKVLQGTPAHAAGLLEGDVILEVDGTSVQGKSLQQVTEAIRGKDGENKPSAALVLSRNGEEHRVEVPMKTMRFQSSVEIVEPEGE